MLKLPVIELFLRLIPEAFLLIFAAYVFSKTPVNKGRYILSSILFGSINYFIRLLPIDYGIHSVLGLILFVILLTNINKINVIKSIQAVFINTITMFICEGVNVIIIQFILKKDMNLVFGDPISKTIYGAPSLLIFACVVGVYYFWSLKRNEFRHV